MISLQPLRKKRIARSWKVATCVSHAAAVICVLLLALLSLLPAADVTRTEMGGSLEHILAWGGSTVVIIVVYRQRAAVLVLVGALVLYAALLELAQFLSPGRHPALSDWGREQAAS
jgi:VanZ family protein